MQNEPKNTMMPAGVINLAIRCRVSLYRIDASRPRLPNRCASSRDSSLAIAIIRNWQTAKWASLIVMVMFQAERPL
jgi:hypothetical protein